MSWSDVLIGLRNEMKQEMKESAYMTAQEFGSVPNMDELFADTLNHLMKNLRYDIEINKEYIIRDVRHSVNGLLDIDDSDEIADEMISDGERALDSYLSSTE